MQLVHFALMSMFLLLDKAVSLCDSCVWLILETGDFWRKKELLILFLLAVKCGSLRTHLYSIGYIQECFFPFSCLLCLFKTNYKDLSLLGFYYLLPEIILINDQDRQNFGNLIL